MVTRIVCLFALVALPAVAQLDPATVEIVPPNPTAADRVTLRFTSPNFLELASVSRTGNHFRFEFLRCHITCHGVLSVPLGRLPARTYTYEISIRDDDSGVQTGSFQIAAVPDVPALSPFAVAVACALLMGTGWVVVGARS